MNKQSELEPLPATDAKPPEVMAHLDSTKVPIRKTLKLQTPFLDADADAFVPGYSDSNDWYEP
jgi:hypothetical protein